MLEQTIDVLETKTCSKCGKVQLRSNFCKDKRARDLELQQIRELYEIRNDAYS